MSQKGGARTASGTYDDPPGCEAHIGDSVAASDGSAGPAACAAAGANARCDGCAGPGRTGPEKSGFGYCGAVRVSAANASSYDDTGSSSEKIASSVGSMPCAPAAGSNGWLVWKDVPPSECHGSCVGRLLKSKSAPPTGSRPSSSLCTGSVKPKSPGANGEAAEGDVDDAYCWYCSARFDPAKWRGPCSSPVVEGETCWFVLLSSSLLRFWCRGSFFWPGTSTNVASSCRMSLREVRKRAAKRRNHTYQNRPAVFHLR